MHTKLACPEDSVLEEFLLGKLDGGQTLPLEEHLAGCSGCADRAESLQTADELVHALRGNPQLLTSPADADALAAHHRRLLALAGSQPQAPLAPAETPDEIGRLGGYCVLRVLGQGGMGLFTWPGKTA